MSPPPDQAEREAARRERRRNVLIDAGPGTGKTTLLTARLVERLAPADDALPALAIDRIAAITFTRRAAGELRLRVRRALLEARAAPASASRRERLEAALAGLDGAWIGTIHGLAGRLLRLAPGGPGPAFELDDEPVELAAETAELLFEAAERGRLPPEAETTLRDALRAGLPAESRETEYRLVPGLDALVRALIERRDRDPGLPAEVPLDRAAFASAVAAFGARVAALAGQAPGVLWLRSLADRLAALALGDGEPDDRRLFREVTWLLEDGVDFARAAGFGDDEAGWELWKAYRRGRPSLREALLAPLSRWMAVRLVRLRPVVLDLHAEVKRRRGRVDAIDLLVVLRDLLRGSPEARAGLAARFDHIFLDEAQDSDPLQVEILLALAGEGDDRLTVIGDRRQSIYRFRRADLATYDHLLGTLRARPHLEVRLSASFRARPALVDWLNASTPRILGGEASPLAVGRSLAGDGDGAPAVEILPVRPEGEGRILDGRWRDAEADALATRLLGLVAERGLAFGDIAVLALATTSLGHLFPAFDRAGIPWASRGGRLFLEDPLHRRFLLALRALADPDDGAAMAALLAPPFFPLGLVELVAGGEAARRARALVAELAGRRLDRFPGATARDLLERTSLAATVAAGPNGAQRLARLRELCLFLERRAAADHLDYDGVTARLRRLVDRPIELDAPAPIGGQAVLVTTVHQAKGLEFPVVVLWDGRAKWDALPEGGAFRVAEGGAGWTVELHRLAWEEPAGAGFAARERRLREEEKRRLLYVAVTRARDLLLLPDCAPERRHILHDLIPR